MYMSLKSKNILQRILKTLAFPLIICVFFAIATKGALFTSRSILAILRQSVLPALVIMAMTPNLSLGMMDMSVGAVVMTSAIIGGNLMNATGWGIPGLLVFCIAVSILMTTLTGILNNKLRVPILVLSLGLMLVYEALPRILFPSDSGAIIKLKFAKLSQIPYILIILAVSAVAFYIILNLTTYGHNLRALGGNDELARRAGLNINKIKLLSFIISGFFAGIAGALYMSSNGQVYTPAAFGSISTVMDAFLGLFLGMFLSRFCDTTVGLIIAVITMTTMTNGFVIMGIDATYRDILKSVVLFLLLAFSGNQTYFIRWRSGIKRAAAANAAYENARI